MAPRGQAPTRKWCVVAPQVPDYPRGNHYLSAALPIEGYLDESPGRRYGTLEVA